MAEPTGVSLASRMPPRIYEVVLTSPTAEDIVRGYALSSEYIDVTGKKRVRIQRTAKTADAYVPEAGGGVRVAIINSLASGTTWFNPITRIDFDDVVTGGSWIDWLITDIEEMGLTRLHITATATPENIPDWQKVASLFQLLIIVE